MHIHAWCRAFRDVGIGVESWRVHHCIGMDGTRLSEFLTQNAEQDVQQRAKDLHLQYFSAGEDELSLLRRVLDSDDVVSAMTSSKDVDAGHVVYVGDAVWDIVTCENAGVPSIGVLSGGVSQEELGNADAERVFDNTRELCDRIDDTAIAALHA
jgi:beta-phosphoglucomutase-like phosphatase (HAD superfamily)